MDAEQLTRGQLESEFSALARTMYFSKSTIASFAKEATRGQLVAVCDLIRDENATREENKKGEASAPSEVSVAEVVLGLRLQRGVHARRLHGRRHEVA